MDYVTLNWSDKLIYRKKFVQVKANIIKAKSCLDFSTKIRKKDGTIEIIQKRWVTKCLNNKIRQVFEHLNL